MYHVREVKADGKQYAVKVAHRDNSGAADALRREYVYLHKVVGQFCGGHRSVARTIGWLHRATDYNELESDEAEEGANVADGGDGADDAAPASVAEVEEEPDTQAGHQRNAGTPAAANGAAAATGDAAPAAEGAAAAGAGGSSAPPSLAWDYGVVLQHVAGGTLRDEAIAAALGPFELLKCTSDVLQGLSFLHETCGLIHRDVKARNVVLERAPEIEPPGAGGGAEAAVPSRLRDIPIQAKLIDFGLACMYRERPRQARAAVVRGHALRLRLADEPLVRPRPRRARLRRRLRGRRPPRRARRPRVPLRRLVRRRRTHASGRPCARVPSLVLRARVGRRARRLPPRPPRLLPRRVRPLGHDAVQPAALEAPRYHHRLCAPRLRRPSVPL